MMIRAVSPSVCSSTGDALSAKPAEEKGSILERIPILNRFTQAAEEEVRKRGMLSGRQLDLGAGQYPDDSGRSRAGDDRPLRRRRNHAGDLQWCHRPALIGFGALLAAFHLPHPIRRIEREEEVRELSCRTPSPCCLHRSGPVIRCFRPPRRCRRKHQTQPHVNSDEPLPKRVWVAPLPRLWRGSSRERNPEDFEWAVMAIEIQREVGGNLAEVLQTVADTMRAQ